MRYDRVVFDTNVLISGALSTESTPARALERAITEGQLLASRATLREPHGEAAFPEVRSPRLAREARGAPAPAGAPVEIVEVVQTIPASRDPRDDKFLDVAVNGRADLLVNGDGDLLELHPFRGITILTRSSLVAVGPWPKDEAPPEGHENGPHGACLRLQVRRGVPSLPGRQPDKR